MALIEIGSAKQLFVDDYLIESITDGSRVLNRAEKVENNPVLRPERPWEGNHVVVSDVIFDEKDQLFKMWYDLSMVSENVRLSGQRKCHLYCSR